MAVRDTRTMDLECTDALSSWQMHKYDDDDNNNNNEQIGKNISQNVGNVRSQHTWNIAVLSPIVKKRNNCTNTKIAYGANVGPLVITLTLTF